MREFVSLTAAGFVLLIAIGCGGSGAVEEELKKAGAQISRKGKDENLATLTRVQFQPEGFREDALPKLVKIEPIHSLSFENCPLTDAGLVHIKDLKNLRVLELRGTKVTREGIASLAGTPSVTGLNSLNLSALGLTDDAVPHLAKLNDVKLMHLHENKITKEGFAELSKALPNTKIQEE